MKKKKIIIMTSILMMSILLFNKVYASENMTYTNAWLDVQQCKQRFIHNDESMNYREELYDCVWDNTNIGTNNTITFGSDNGHLRKMEFNISDSGYYYPGNYVIYFKWGIDPRNRTKLNKYIINVYLFDGNKEIESNGVRCTYGVGSGNYESTTVCQFNSLYNFDRVMVQYYWQEQDNLVDNNNALNNTNAMSFNSIEYFTYDDNPSNAINSQTQVIEKGFEDVLNDNHNYNNNPSENIDSGDLGDLGEEEDNIINQLDFGASNNLDITINPNSSSFIWYIVNRLRTMNTQIVILMTSILGLGIIKLILNR